MKQNQNTIWIPDATQREIIDINEGCHLVLAPPGCGKTQILSERIRRAHALGVAYEDMLCLTFTNRAARGMRDRISENIADDATGDVFVGNVHRFCSRFLFENAVVPAESAIIDDDTVMSIIAMYLREDEERALASYQRRQYYSQIVFFSHLMYEIEHGIAKPLRLHPECATGEDVAVLRAICQLLDRPFTAEAMIDIYDHTDFYLDLVRSEAFDVALRQTAVQTITKMHYAHAYEAYKHQNNLLDFEDLLQKTYVALKETPAYKRYPWIQVDEVQDLNMMQLAIIDALSTCGVGEMSVRVDANKGTIMYLGDEMQAIFSFMGAKLQILELLKQRCKSRVHHLGVNHRSPKYLVDLLNTYAVRELHSSPDLLPESKNEDEATGEELRIVASDNIETEMVDVVRIATGLYNGHPDETTAIIVNTNHDADIISRKLSEEHLSHFKVSGTDLFATPEVKLVMAHLSVLDNERNFLAWSRLMKGLMVCRSNASARRFVHELEMRAITPSDFFDYEDSTYIREFTRIYREQDIVVFDTETTGLNVFDDDVIQIAAERIRNGKTVAKFSVHIETEREIPKMLGDVVNPIIDERKHQTIYSHEEGLQKFLDFLGDDVLLGHNAEYDYRIMDYNLRRYLPRVDWQREHPICLDSLKIIRLLRPDLKAFKLKSLLKELHLEGENSHLADDDVNATVSLLGYSVMRAHEFLDSQREYIGRKTTQERIRLLRQNYHELYATGCDRLYRREQRSDGPAVVAEMKRFYVQVRSNGWMREIPKMAYIFRFLTDDVIDEQRDPSLKEQLSRHIMEMNTFKEADLCGSSTIDDRIFVTTIHKAKGLEFDNVIVFDVVDGRLPNYYSEGDPKAVAEDARKLYVAMSRAKRRLVITYSLTKKVGREMKPQQLSRFLDTVMPFFKQ
ncbi:MAG: 3'-5' exonuclease [Prevotella sp.]|jgi:DNA helicase-2/ATP-dependent DNA helicase PcrA